MIRWLAILTAAGTLSACASACERDTPSLVQSNDNRYGGIAEAQGGCRGDTAPVSRSRLQSFAG